MNVIHRPLALLAVVASLVLPWASAHAGGAGQEKVVPLQSQKLPDVPGKQAIMVVVSYEPGQASVPHLHSGSVFAYVLEGEVVSQLGDGPPVTYKAGDSWFETPRIAHRVSRNASKVRPAKLLAWLVMNEGATVTEPLPQ